MEGPTLFRSFRFAWNGLHSAFQEGLNFRIQLLAGMLALFVLFLGEAEAIWWGLFLFTIGSVLAAEVFNTALEKALDRLHPEKHKDIAKAKDCAAGSVLLLSLCSIGMMIAFVLSH